MNRVEVYRRVLGEKGLPLAPGSTVLDFGCGTGALIREFHAAGHQAYGCELPAANLSDDASRALLEKGTIRIIRGPGEPLPFSDGMFDLVVSTEVFEHVEDYPAVISELWRITRPGGLGLHLFPARWSPLEQHMHIPFGGVLKNRSWIALWSHLGVRGDYHRKSSATDFTAHAQAFLGEKVNYLTRRQIRNQFRQYFSQVMLCERAFLKQSARGRYLYYASFLAPFLPRLYGGLRKRVVAVRKGIPPVQREK